MKSIAIGALVAISSCALAQVPMSIYDLNNRVTPYYAADPVHVGSLEGRLTDLVNGGSTASSISFATEQVGFVKKSVAALANGQFLRALHGMPNNGGGSYTNIYTIMMDVKMEPAGAGSWFSMFNTTANVANDGDSFVRWDDVNGNVVGRIGISGTYVGEIQPNKWVRIAIVVKCATAGSYIRYYADGQFIHQVDLAGDQLDGRWSGYTWGDPDIEDHIDLFGDNDGDFFNGSCSSVAFFPEELSDLAIAFLGTANGTAEITSGTPFGGDLSSLQASDDDKFYILNDESMPNSTLVLSAFTPWFSATSITVTTETNSTRTDLAYFTDLLNSVSNTYTTINVTTSTTADTVRSTVVTTGLNEYLSDLNGQITTRLRWIPAEDLVAEDGWSVAIDHFMLEIAN